MVVHEEHVHAHNLSPPAGERLFWGALYTSRFFLPLPKADDLCSAKERELTRCRNELVPIH